MLILRPSSAPIWVNCSLQPKLAATVPDLPPDDPAMEGTCAAWLAEMVMKGHVEKCSDLLNQPHPENGWVVDAAMVQHVQKYVDMLRSYDGRIDVERKVALTNRIQGTPDAFGVLVNNTLIVDDLKYGYDPVEPWSEQIVIYAAAIMRHLRARNVVIRQITLGIYQPRAYHSAGIHRKWTIFPEDLGRRANAIIAASERTDAPDASATPGPWCTHCKAASVCQAVAHETYRAYHTMWNGQNRQMTAVELKNELDFLELASTFIKARKNAVTNEAMARMDRGEHVMGWHRESGHGQRRWKVRADVVRAFTGIDPTSGKMVTPAELERQGANVAVVNALTETPRTKPKLKPIGPNDIARKFGEI